MDFGDDDDIDDETFALVDKIVEEHNAKKAQTQLQSQAVSPIMERQGSQNGPQAHQMRPAALFPTFQPRAPAAQAPQQVQRPPLPPGGAPVGRITHAAAQLRAEAPPVANNRSPPHAGALALPGGNRYAPPPLPPVQGSLQAQQRLNELEGTNKILRTNLDNVERDRNALKLKIQQLEAKNSGSGGGGVVQAASMVEMQRQLEQMRQQLLFKDQELEESKRKASSRLQETAGTSVGAGAGAAQPKPPQQQQQQQQASERIKRRANGTEVPVSITHTTAQQGIPTPAPPTPLFPASTLAEIAASAGGDAGGGGDLITENPSALIALLWASCPDSMSTLLTLDTSLYSSALSTPLKPSTLATKNAGAIRGDFSELSRLHLILKNDFSKAAAGLVQPFTLLGSLTTYVSRVCYVINTQQNSQQISGNYYIDQQLKVASSALTILRHLILNDSACRHAALVSCGCTIASTSITSSHINGIGKNQSTGIDLLTRHSNRITFEKDPNATFTSAGAAAVGGNTGGGGIAAGIAAFASGSGSRIGGGSGIEAGLQPLIAQLSRLNTNTGSNNMGGINNNNNAAMLNGETANDGGGQSATGLQALCITAARVLPVGVADLAHALVTCTPIFSSAGSGNASSGGGRFVFLPLLHSGAVLALLRGVAPQRRCRGVQLLHSLLEDPQISNEFAEVCATPSSWGDGGGVVEGAAAAADTPKTRAAAAAAAREAQLTKSNKKSNAKDNSNNNKTDGEGEGVHSWASELMIALLNCLVLVIHREGQEKSFAAGQNAAGIEIEASTLINNVINQDSSGDDTVVARAALSVMALLLEKRCTACFMRIFHLDDTALRRRNSINGGGGSGAGAGLGSGGAGGSGNGNGNGNNSNAEKNGININKTSPSSATSSETKNIFTVSFPVRLVELAEECVKYRGDDEDVTLLRTALWPIGRSPAERAAQSMWQHRLRLAQESLTLLRGLILTEGSVANVALEELLLTPQLAQRMLAATGRMTRITATAPPLPALSSSLDGSDPTTTTTGISNSVIVFPSLPVAAWAYAIGSSSNAASLAPMGTAERRAGLPCCSANDVSYLARGIRNRILYKLRC